MKKKNNAIAVFLIIVIFVVFTITCKTTNLINREDPYPNMEIVHYGKSQAYIFKNNTSDKLLILIDGVGWNSVLGVKHEEKWQSVSSGGLLLPVLKDTYTVMILEQLNRKPGQTYSEDMEDRANYTADNLLNGYIESVNGYLAEHSFTSVVLIGFYDGACLLPLVYEKIKQKSNVKALVSMGFGGFSWYESVYTLSERKNIPSEYVEVYKYLVEVYKPGGNDYPDSYKEDAFGLTYRWFNSFMNIRPFDYYKNINIPVLFMHGDYDYIHPVESTVFIQENLTENSFSFLYYRWDTQPRKYSQVTTWRKELVKWIVTVDK